MMFESMPEGGTTTVKSGKYGPFNQTVREAKTRWVLNPEDEGVPQVVVDLTTTHRGESKQFFTSLSWSTVEQVHRHPKDGPGAMSVETWSSDHMMVRIHANPVARYSVKAMEAHHGEALEIMGRNWDHVSMSCSMVFEQAAVRSGLNVQEV